MIFGGCFLSYDKFLKRFTKHHYILVEMKRTSLLIFISLQVQYKINVLV